MKNITLGKTGITTPQNAFSTLPLQGVDMETAVTMLRKAHEGGMTFFDTARSYSNSEVKMGIAFDGIRDEVILASKTMADTPGKFKADLEATLRNLRTDHLDIYQFHFMTQCYRPGDCTGMYEAMMDAKKEGKILHIGAAAHKISVAEEIAESGLYETLNFPFSYLATDRDIALVKKCEENGVGFIASKGLAGGLLTNAKACMAFMAQYNVLPVWGIQTENELYEWLEFFDEEPAMTDEIRQIIEKDKVELAGDFCRGCGNCMPCTVNIQINQCARMMQIMRRTPKEIYSGEYWRKEMDRIDRCLECGMCKKKCPYELDVPKLLRKNLEEYREVIAGRKIVE